MAAHNELGKWGEDCAVDYLQRMDYAIVARDWKSGHRDIDIIAQDGDTLVFVEVKTRRNRDIIDPLQAVDYKKLKNLRLAINHYVNYRKTDQPWRFDVIAIVGTLGGATPEINHIEDFPIM